MAQFRTKARAVELLGKGQIADLPTAISELWKNGYDAYASELSCDLYMNGYKDIHSPAFVLSDTGTGMSRQDILEKWIVLGTDSKARGMNYQIKTGDVFILDKAINGTDKRDEHLYQYLLCITQSCDALRPSKVNNNLAFALGEVSVSTSDVKNAETGYHTFLPDKKIIVWTNKFFTIFVKDTIFSLTPDAGKFTFHYIDGDFTATFLGTQKEAYTHRIINNVFSNAMRIGIDLPHKLG